jgi:hypothetical protein
VARHRLILIPGQKTEKSLTQRRKDAKEEKKKRVSRKDAKKEKNAKKTE